MSATVALSRQEEISSALGIDSQSSTELARYAADEIAPAALAEPENVSAAASVLKLASEREWAVMPVGGFSRAGWGNIPERSDIAVRTSKMNSVLQYDPGDLTISVEAGAKLAHLERTLAEHNQFLPINPVDPEQTVGGLIATALQGPMQNWAMVRDFCIGVGFVTGDGKIAKAGGRVVKNVAGYDLMKLLVGSYGTLALITSANFRVYPRPKQTRTFVMDFATREEALAIRDRIVHSPLAPLCLEIASPRALEYLQAAPVEARDPDHYAPDSPVAPETHWRLALRAAGSDAVLARYARELGSAVSKTVDAVEEAALWSCFGAFGERVLGRYRNSMLLQVSTTISDTKETIAAIEAAALDNNLLPAFVGRAGLAVLSVAMVPLSVDPPSAMQYANAASALRSELPAGSTAIVLRCPIEAKRHFDVWGTPSSDLASMRAIKRAMDPKNILNRGRFVV
ncbi:MAG: FAD-binding oxidoreductase [Terriglobales bacterium]